MSNEFPKWKYHANQPSVTVNDAKEEKDLGAGWYDTPAETAGKGPNPESAYSEEDRLALIEKAKGMGLKPKSNAKAETVALAIAAKEAENAPNPDGADHGDEDHNELV